MKNRILLFSVAVCAGLSLAAMPRAFAQNLYINDFDNSQVLEYTQSGTLAATFSSGGLYVNPDGLAFSGSSLYVSAQNASTGDGGIYRYDLNAFAAPTLFAADPGGVLSGLVFGGGNLYAADSQNSKIVVFNSQTGAQTGSFGSGTLVSPVGLAYQSNSLYVSDAGSSSVQKYDSAGASQGTFVSAGSGGLSLPGTLAFDSAGNLLVASGQGTSNGFVARYDGNGAPNPSAGNTGAVFASSPSLFNPYGLAVSADGTVFAGDRNSNLSNGSGGGGHFDQFNAAGVFVQSDVFGSGGNGNPYGLAFGPATPAAVPEASTVASFGLLLTLGLGLIAVRRRVRA